MISRAPSPAWYRYATKLEHSIDSDLSAGPEIDLESALKKSLSPKAEHHRVYFLAGALAAGAFGLMCYFMIQESPLAEDYRSERETRKHTRAGL